MNQAHSSSESGRWCLRCALLGCAVALQAPAQLFNPGFEDPGASIANWVAFNNVAANVQPAPSTPRSGTNSLKIFGDFGGATNYSGAFQSRAASTGQLWEARGFFRHNAADALAGANRCVLKIEFYSVFGGTYGSANMLGEFQTTALSAASPTDTWLEASVLAAAPAGTLEARLAIVFTQAGQASGSVFADDLSFRTIAGPPAQAWTMVWNDEFDGPAVDPAKWRIEDLHLIKNNELQYYAPDDVYIQDGRLVLRSRQRSYWGFDSNGNWRHFDYTSGLVESPERFAIPYGRIEVRAKLPSTRGIWPAHWMLPSAGQWPPEIDIMELLGHQPTRVYMSNHWGQWPNVQTATTSYDGPNYASELHTFAVEWSAGRLDFYVDGIPRARNTAGVAREPFYVILNTAVGGNWPGNPDGSTVFPQYHEIDYVRVFVPSDPGLGIATLTDATPSGATVDGQRGASEYVAVASGINAGLSDLIGRNSELYLDSSVAGVLNLAIESHTAWPAGGPYGAVIYVDSVDGGYFCTADFADVADRSRRMASGKGSAGQRSDLHFADGFLADFAIVLASDAARVYQLQSAAHTFIGGALLDAATDLSGGTQYEYRIDDGSLGRKLREVRMPLAALGVAPGATLRLAASILNGDTAFRGNEFFGAVSGNPWDAANPGTTPVVFKMGDFLRFVTVAGCGDGCDVSGGDADVDDDCDVDLSDLSRLLAGFGTLFGATHAQGDVDADEDVDLGDLSKLLSKFGQACP